MLHLNFSSTMEQLPGDKWQKLFQKHWPAYKAWFHSKGAFNNPDLDKAQDELKKYMPEWIGTYEKLCALAGNDKSAARFLTGYQPPAYITGCSQAVWQNKPQLVRNYDYHPNLCEGTLLNSAWNGKYVIAVGDCLCGVVDGMNSDGLVASLTFGGRKVVGKGFGIPFILRYVLEFCSDVQEATEVLKRIPSHMSYNVAVLDKTGAFKMLQIAPDRKTKVTDLPVSTNHQGEIDWPEHASFSKTLQREKFLINKLADENLTEEKIAESFLEPPLFNRQYSDGFGTIYTSVYRPAEGYMELRWENESLRQSFADFEEGDLLISYTEKAPSKIPQDADSVDVPSASAYQYQYDIPDWEAYGKAWGSGNSYELSQIIAKTIGTALGIADTPAMKKIFDEISNETKVKGQIPWEMLADVWATVK